MTTSAPCNACYHWLVAATDFPADFPAARLRPTEQGPLLVGLAVSLSCHLLLFGLAEHPRIAHAPRAALPLIVALQPETTAALVSETVPRVTASFPATSPPQRRATPSAVRAGASMRSEKAPQPEYGNRESRLPDAAGLLDAARRQLDAESRRRTLDPMFSPPQAPTRPHQTDALERALGTGMPRVEQLADGTVRVTGANGRQHCLQPIPEVVARGLPQAPISTPTNCP